MSPSAPPIHRRRLRLRLAAALGVAAVMLVTVGSSPAAGGPLPDPLVATDGNLLVNASFEVADRDRHPAGWSFAPEPSAQSASIYGYAGGPANIHSGHGSLQIIDPSPGTITLRSAPVTGFEGVGYTAKAWVKNGSGTTARYYLEFWNAANARIGVVDTQPSSTTAWQQVSLTSVAPAGTVHVNVAIYGGVNSSGTSYYDDVSLVANPAAYNPALGTARELFLDDHRIESATNVGRVVHPATKRGAPLIVPDKPWESSVYIYGSVITGTPGAAYKMWYTAYSNTIGAYLLCYATSADGITWTKPNLGKVDYLGSTANNILNKLGGTVAYNPTEATAPNAKPYKLLTYDPDPQGYHGFVSADGISWDEVASTPRLPYGDVSNLTYDAAKNQYIATTKQRTVDIATTPITNDRMAFVSTSRDFVNWTTPRLAVEGDARDDAAAVGAGGLEAQIYGMPVYPYESTYVAMPWVYDIDNYTEGVSASSGDGPIVPQIASSQDLVRWSRPARQPVLRLGESGAWDDSMIFTSTTLHVNDSTVSVYYGGFNVAHGGGNGQTAKIGLASWRRDGWVSLHNAGDDAGTVVTKPITFTGDALHLNTVVKAGGSVRVEILNAAGTAPENGFAVGQAVEITGDRLNATAQWTGGRPLSELVGQQVRLKFHLDGADLYSYWF